MSFCIRDLKIDAIRSPISFAGQGDALTRLRRLQSEFSQLLNCKRIYVRNQGGDLFITGDPHDTLYALCKTNGSVEPVYRWVDRGDGIQYGFRKENELPAGE